MGMTKVTMGLFKGFAAEVLALIPPNPSGVSLGTPVAASNAAVDFINIPAGMWRP